MPQHPKPDETQTTPEGAEIPVPKRADVFRDLRKAAKAEPQPEASDD